MNRNPPGSPASKIGAKRNITRQAERTFKRGSLMFIEGETSTEMFILRSGKVRILKQEGDKTVELAILGPGSVLGELSLLDHQPRGATAQVVEEVTTTVIDEALFDNTMRSIPPWLANIVQLVVKRLRDTMKKTSDDIVHKSVVGVLKVLMLLYDTEGATINGMRAVPLARAKDAVNAAIGIGEIETENVLLHLIVKEMVFIRKNDAGREFVIIRDPDVSRAYITYLRTRQRGAKVRGEDLDDDVVALIDTILAAGAKTGRRIKNNIVRLSAQQIALEQDRRGGGHALDPNLVDPLLEEKMLVPEGPPGKTHPQAPAQAVYLYSEDALKKALLLHHWLPTFKEEIRF